MFASLNAISFPLKTKIHSGSELQIQTPAKSRQNKKLCVICWYVSLTENAEVKWLHKWVPVFTYTIDSLF